MKRLSKVKILWSPEFAYAIGLITTDGNLSKDGRHLNMTSKDKELIITFKECLGLKNRIGKKSRGGSKIKKYFQVQFGDKNFYDFLISIGLMPAKSKIIENLNIPNEYFIDFFRGCIDGDGNIDVHSHPESQHLQLRLRLVSASPKFINWIKKEVKRLFKIEGGWIEESAGVYIVSYGKADSIKLLKLMYYDGVRHFLNRKFQVAKKFMGE